MYTVIGKVASATVGRFCWWYVKRSYKTEWQFQSSRRLRTRPIEYGFVFKSICQVWPKTVLDVGTGGTALPSLIRTCGPMVTASDNVVDYWPKGMFNRHYYVVNDNIVKTRIQNTFDLITCVSVIEHIIDFNAAVESMFSLLNPNGHLVLTCPYCENRFVENVFELEEADYGKDYPFVCRVFSRRERDYWLRSFGGRIVEQEYWEFFSGELWSFGDRLFRPRQVSAQDRHHLGCMLIRKT